MDSRQETSETLILDAQLDEMFRTIPSSIIDKIENLARETPDREKLIKNKTTFISGSKFFCRNDGSIEYPPEEVETEVGRLKLLHEYGHKLLDHSGEVFDSQLLENERSAWLFALKVYKKTAPLSAQQKKTALESFKTYQTYVDKRHVCIACSSINIREFAPQLYSCQDCYTDY